jgi:hypothetical protein
MKPTEYQLYHRLKPFSTSKDITLVASLPFPVSKTMARLEGNATELGQPADQPSSLFPEWKDSLASLSDQSKNFVSRTSKDLGYG